MPFAEPSEAMHAGPGPSLEKEPLTTRHSGHEDWLEGIRIFGWGFSHLSQALFYLLILVGAVLIVMTALG